MEGCPIKERKRGRLRVWASLVGGMETFCSFLGGIASKHVLTPYNRKFEARLLGGMKANAGLLGGMWVAYDFAQFPAPYLEVDKPEVQWLSTAYSIDYKVHASVNWIVEGNN